MKKSFLIKYINYIVEFFLISILIITPIVTILSTVLGACLGSLGNYWIHKRQLRHDKQEKEKDRQLEIKLKLIDKIETKSSKELKELFENCNTTLSAMTKLVNDWEKVKKKINNKVSENHDISLDNQIKLNPVERQELNYE